MKELKLKNSRLDGRYDIIDCLGRGSYSEIYRARAITPTSEADREVVIKALNVFLQGVPETDLERTLIENFQNEALALDRVRHPNIIRRLGHGTALDMGGQPFHYLVLEYMPGGDLYTLCRDTPFRLENALYYLEQVCAGLAHAHACGIIHRDIKPQNLLLTADRRTVKIADFGVAKLNISDEQITRVGTNVYAPPEHSPDGPQGVEEEPKGVPQRLTPAADVYSLAKTLYTLLAGESPRRYGHRPIEDLPPSLLAQSWGPGLLRVLRRATQTAPGARHQDVRAFWKDVADAALQTVTTAQTPPAVASARHNISRELSSASASDVSAAPPRPRFESATNLRDEILPQNQAAPNPRARVVVPVGNNEKRIAPPVLMPPDVIERLPDAALRPSLAARLGGQRSARIFVALALVAIFLGMLLATNYYVKNYWNKNTPTRNRNRNSNTASGTPAQPSPTGNTTPKPSPTINENITEGAEGTAIMDVNLRSGPGASTRKLGTIGKDSRVRVIKINGAWAEVQVLNYVTPQGNAMPRPEDGWVNLKNIALQEQL